MKLSDIRSRFLRFYADRGHAVIPSASLVPHGDPTTLFTGSGMQPLVPYLLGKDHPAGSRLVNSQKCFRAGDIEEVGDNRHTTFFEMLGNWSLGDYFKREQLPWFFEFLTKEIGIDPNRLYVTVFDGADDIGVPRDEESIEIWKELFSNVGIEAKFISIGSEANGSTVGMQGGRIFGYTDKNWWSRLGAPRNMPVGEPGGPDAEVFYDFGTEHDPAFGELCHPNCDCGRFLELGNSVFMQYIKTEKDFDKLPKQNVDFGGGLERIAAVRQGFSDAFRTDAFTPIISVIEKISGRRYNDPKAERSFRIIADHLKAAVVLIADGVVPAKSERGYFVRRLIRRSVEHGDRIGIRENGLSAVVAPIVELYGDAYPELREHEKDIARVLEGEEQAFRKTLARGLRELEKGTDAFTLFTTYGFPFELTKEIALEKGIPVDERAFMEHMERHQELSRSGSEQKFKGGLADSSDETTRLHTAHHLLLKALQIVLGPHVHQRGSNITADRLRIDFFHSEKMTATQKAEVERIVNEKIAEGLPVIRTEMNREEAEKLNAEREFGAKYPDRVSVYSIGPLEGAFSIEFCGGPHVENTREIGDGGKRFVIQKEEASSAGVRRIKAVLE
jgi:alanyl-tRNA synthetase